MNIVRVMMRLVVVLTLFLILVSIDAASAQTSGIVIYKWGDDLYRINVGDSAEGTQTPFVRNLDLGSNSLSWSRDGSRLLFGYNTGIHIMNSDGTGLQRLTGPSRLIDYDPSWSPDERQIAFVSTRDGNSDIYVMNSDGSSQTRVTQSPAGGIDPSWSPSGTQLVFVSGGTPGTSQIFVINPDGSGLVQMTNLPGYNILPLWSPDSTMIVFAHFENAASCPRLYRMSASGTGAGPITAEICDLTQPQWLPDSQTILYLQDRTIYAVEADGTNLRVFQALPTVNFDPITAFAVFIPPVLSTPTATFTPSGTPMPTAP